MRVMNAVGYARRPNNGHKKAGRWPGCDGARLPPGYGFAGRALNFGVRYSALLSSEASCR